MTYSGTAYNTEAKCWKCAGFLWRLEPPVQGWPLYCPDCKHLTDAAPNLATRMANTPPGTLGVVVAVDFPLTLVGPGGPTPQPVGGNGHDLP